MPIKRENPKLLDRSDFAVNLFTDEIKAATYNQTQKLVQLELELSEIKAHQTSMIHQYEIAQKDLQATNAKLATINDELKMRNIDLTKLGSDLNNLLASVEIPVLIVGGDHRIQRFSPEARRAFNLISSDIGRPFGDIKSNFNINLDALVTEVAETLKSKDIEIQDSQEKWVRIQIRPYKTVDNTIDGVVMVIINIDLLKQKEIQINESFKYITSVADTVPLPVAVINSKCEFQSGNQSFYNYFRSAGKFIGQDIFSSLNIREQYGSALRQLISKTLTENRLFVDFEMEYKAPHLGHRRIVMSVGKIHWIGSEEAAVLISFDDVTQQRDLEEEKKLLLRRAQDARSRADSANEAKDVFLATLSHELRTPLSSILMWAQLISQGKVDFEKAQQGAKVIEQNAKTQSQLIDDLLDISRIIAGKLILNMTTVNPSEVILSAIESVKPLAEVKNIKVIFDISQESASIQADPLRLQQIIWNLLTNAIKFSPSCSVIRVELKDLLESDLRFVQIRVSDQGKGIQPEFLPQIFKRFSQADGATTREHGGLGLGLSIVHNLVKLQGGTVKAENSDRGTGAVFTITFPFISLFGSDILPTKLLNTPERLMTVNDQTKCHPGLDGLKILYVDDNDSAREAISIYLKYCGAQVTEANSAKAAFEKLRFHQPDILVSDIAMPDEDGYSLIRKIRAMSPEKGGRIPALALTALAATEDTRQAVAAGFQAHLAKPVEAAELSRMIVRVSQIVVRG